jgi:hypothetical protein
MSNIAPKLQSFDDKSRVRSALVDPTLLLAKANVSDFPEQLLCGAVTKINPDEQLNARLIDSFLGLAGVPTGDVVFFEDSEEGKRLLRLLIENADLLGVAPVVLKGYPDSDYTPAFDQMTWNLPSVAYAELVAEVVSFTRIEGMKRDEAGERQKKPPREQELSKPRTSHFTGFEQEEITDDAGDGS